MKPRLDRVLGLSDDRADLGEAESLVKSERDHRAITALER
jgi:hypothetical protein